MDKIICNNVVFKSDGIYFQVMKPNSTPIGWINIPCNLTIENPVTVAFQPLIEALNDKNYKNVVFEFDNSLTITYKKSNSTKVKEILSEFINYTPPNIPITLKTTTMSSQNFFQALDNAAFALSSDHADSPLCDFALHENFIVTTDRIVLTSQLNVTMPYFNPPFVLCRQIASLLPKSGVGTLGTFDINPAENNVEKTTGLLINTTYKKIPIQYFVFPLPNRYPAWKKILDTDSRTFVPLCNISKYDSSAIISNIDSIPTVEIDRQKYKYILLVCRDSRICIESFCQDKENKRLVCSEKSISHLLLNKFAVALRVESFKGLLAKNEDIQIFLEINTKNNKEENYTFDKLENQLMFYSESCNAAMIALGFAPTDNHLNDQTSNKAYVCQYIQKAKEITEIIDLSVHK
ncbi:MAG: hypothetical protein LBE18_03875 [Planctomycetaceae bacterium]|nr:hypothetical protein [Planctomycetaceae bacterium]